MMVQGQTMSELNKSNPVVRPVVIDEGRTE